MNITILGTGNMAQGFAAALAKAGHSVTVGSRDLAKAEVLAQTVGAGAKSASLGDAAAASDLVILAVPFDAAAAVVAAAGGLAGKTVVDITNPLTADFSGLTVGHTTSAAEQIQAAAPAAKVVKAFNTIFASVLPSGSAAGKPATVFVAGDDAAAVGQVTDLAKSIGFVPLAVGTLAAARYLEPVAGLNIALAYGLGRGTDIAPTWQGVA